MSDLDPSHRWGERNYNGGRIPLCLDCRVDGFDDEPRAVTRCPGPPKHREENEPCYEEKDSWDDPGHHHTCVGGMHPQGMHFCGDCRQWWGK